MKLDRNPETPAFTAEDIARWERAPLAEVVKYVVGVYHVPTRLEMDRLQEELQELVQAHGDTFPELERIRVHFVHLVEDLRGHFTMEEKVLFPALLAPLSAQVAAEPEEHLEPMRLMRAEHDAAFELLENIRILTSDYSTPTGAPERITRLFEAMAALEDNLHRHIYLENHIIFRRAIPQ